MEAFAQKLCNEHKNLIEKLKEVIEYSKSIQNGQEFALVYHQVKMMNEYETALRERLYLAGVTVANGQYFETPANIEEVDEEKPEEIKDAE